jgi:hypothetical protein
MTVCAEGRASYSFAQTANKWLKKEGASQLLSDIRRIGNIDDAVQIDGKKHAHSHSTNSILHAPFLNEGVKRSEQLSS